MKKIPCIKCTSGLWNYIKPYLEEWNYIIRGISDWNIFSILVLNESGTFGVVSNWTDTGSTYYNRELVTNVEEFLQKASELKGFTYKRKDIMEINGVEIKPGMVIVTEDDDFWIVFPTKNDLGVISYRNDSWIQLESFIRNDSQKIIMIRDLVDRRALAGGKILWEKPKEVIITMDEIAKKFGYPVEIIKIKK